jgi:uncharacterized protein (TIGR03000 family)
MTASKSRRALGWCAVLAAGVLLLTPGESQAQRGRGGRGYGGYGGGYGWGGTSYGYPSYGYGGRYGSYYAPGYSYYSPGYAYSGTTPYAYNYPYTAQGSVVTPTYAYPPATYAYPPATTGTSTVTQSLYRPAMPPNAARLTVLLPAADAQVWIQGTQMTETGAMREFVSPSLTPGENFTYEVRAVWNQGGQQMDQTRSVRVRANEASVADFRVPAANSPPSTPSAPATTTTPPPPPAP